MRSRKLIAAAALGLLLPCGAVLAQDNTSASQDRQQHLSNPSKPVTVAGTVVKYTAGQSIVLRGNEGQEVTYPLAADASAPADVAVGSNVILYGDASGNKVARIVMSDSATGGKPDSTSAGSPTSSSSSASSTTSPGSTSQGSSYGAQSAPPTTNTTTTTTTTTEVTTVTGTVKSYDAGRSITITRPDGTTVSYTITQQSAVPSKLENGKTVVIRTRNQNGQQTVERITYSSSSPKS